MITIFSNTGGKRTSSQSPSLEKGPKRYTSVTGNQPSLSTTWNTMRGIQSHSPQCPNSHNSNHHQERCQRQGQWVRTHLNAGRRGAHEQSYTSEQHYPLQCPEKLRAGAHSADKRITLQSSNHQIFDQWDKAGKLLAWLANSWDSQTCIPRIVNVDGQTVTTPQGIQDAYLHYYSNLYESRANYTQSQLENYLSCINFPQLSQEEADALDAPIILQEVREAVAALPQGKTPGPDGFPAAWYKLHSDSLSQHLHQTFLDAIDNETLPPSFYEAVIVLIHKEGKEPELCES